MSVLLYFWSDNARLGDFFKYYKSLTNSKTLKMVQTEVPRNIVLSRYKDKGILSLKTLIDFIYHQIYLYLTLLTWIFLSSWHSFLHLPLVIAHSDNSRVSKYDMPSESPPDHDERCQMMLYTVKRSSYMETWSPTPLSVYYRRYVQSPLTA